MPIFRSLDSGCWSTKKFVLWKSAISHSIKLPFDAEVDENLLNVIYYLRTSRQSVDLSLGISASTNCSDFFNRRHIFSAPIFECFSQIVKAN